MKKALGMMVFAAALVVFGASYAFAQAAYPIQKLDIDWGTPGTCELYASVDSGRVQIFDEGPYGHVISNKRWIIGECHRQLDADQIADWGGPFQAAQLFVGFDCRLETEDAQNRTRISHAVLTPDGEFNAACVAPYRAK